MQNLESYSIAQKVEVRVNNPKNGNKHEWRVGKVIKCKMIYPSTGNQHRPYPMLLVEFKRTYCKATPIIKTMNVNGTEINVFVDNTLEFYDTENIEGFSNRDEVRPIS